MKKILLFLSFCLLMTVTISHSQTQWSRRISNKVKEADLKLNEVYQSVLDVYKTDTMFIENFKTAQRHWIKLRDAQINAKYSKDAGIRYGDSLPVYKAIYLKTLTEERTQELEEWLSLEDQSVNFVNAVLPWYSYTDGLKAAEVSGKKILLCTEFSGVRPRFEFSPTGRSPIQPSSSWYGADRNIARFVKADSQLAKYLDEHFILIKVNTEETTGMRYRNQRMGTVQLFRSAGGSALMPSNVMFAESNGVRIDVLYQTGNQGTFTSALHFIAEEMYRDKSLTLNNYLTGKGQKPNQPVVQQRQNQPAMYWYSYTDGSKLSKPTGKKILLNAHGAWSPFCIQMNKTYEDTSIRNYIAQYFIPVKVDVDTKDTFLINNKSLNAYALLGDELKVTGYPSTLFFESDGKKIDLISGFYKPDVFIHILRFFAEEKYKTTSIEQYLLSCGVTEKITR